MRPTTTCGIVVARRPSPDPETLLNVILPSAGNIRPAGPSAEGKTRKPQAASRPHPGRDEFAHAPVSETLDLRWALMALNIRELEWEVIDGHLGHYAEVPV